MREARPFAFAVVMGCAVIGAHSPACLGRDVKPLAAGLHLSIELESSVFAVDEPILAKCTLCNTLEQDLALERPMTLGGGSREYFYIVRAVDMKQLRSPRPGIPGLKIWRPGDAVDSWLITLAPDACYEFVIDLAVAFARMDADDPEYLYGPHTINDAGFYGIQCFYTNFQEYGTAPMWRGWISSEVVNIQVTEGVPAGGESGAPEAPESGSPEPSGP